MPEITCALCGGPVWDNTAPGAKKNPKGPDYKCKNKDCGHAVWLKNEPGYKKEVRQSALPVKPTNGGNNLEMMRLAYRKDLMCAVLNQFGSSITTEDAKKIFIDLWTEVEK